MSARKRPLSALLPLLVAMVAALGTVALSLAAGPLTDRATMPDMARAVPPRPYPLAFLPVEPDEAQKLNAAIPFRPLGPAARPFFLTGDPLDRERALDCLSSAMWYEAGDDARGQYAVAQVVLNRVRHPAFPTSICGVVFQGSERNTGCQFTFTCDGALGRIPSPGGMGRTRQRAEEMLGGRVAPEVGLATHYHTDWVHPVWSPELEKIAQVETHLFFRWGNGWGGPSVMRQRYAGAEPVAAGLAMLFPAHQPTTSTDLTLPPELAGATHGPPGPSRAPGVLGEGRFEVFLSPLRNGNVQAMAALDLCGDRARCSITGYLDSGEITRGPVVFTFERDREAKIERARWDCTRFRRPTTTQCMGTTGQQ